MSTIFGAFFELISSTLIMWYDTPANPRRILAIELATASSNDARRNSI
jgi:hypothetical protein